MIKPIHTCFFIALLSFLPVQFAQAVEASGIRMTAALDSGGLKINGRTHYDAIGDIKAFSTLSETGSLTYQVEDPNGQLVVKVMAIDDFQDQYEIGAFDNSQNVRIFVTANEKHVYHDYKLVSRGVILISDSHLLYLSPDSPSRVIILPENYHISDIQQDDISATKHALLTSKSAQSGLQHYMLVNLISGNFTQPFKLAINGEKMDNVVATPTDEAIDTLAETTPIRLQYTSSQTEAPIEITYNDGYARVVLRNLHSNHF